jgi:hypothetical protein
MLARRWLINLGLLVLLAGLLLAARLDVGEALRETRLTALAPADIAGIELHRAGEPAVRLKRDDAGWQMLAPYAVPADAASVAKLLPVAAATLTRTLPAAGLDLGGLGLDPAPVRIVLDGLELRFGGTEPVADQRYVQIGDMVHLIDDRFLPRLMTPTLELVSRRLLPADFSPGLGDLDGEPLTAGALAPLADALAVRVETPPDLRDGGDPGQSLRIGSADGGDALEFLVSDGGTRWTRLEAKLSWRFATPPLDAVRSAPALPMPPPPGRSLPTAAMPTPAPVRPDEWREPDPAELPAPPAPEPVAPALPTERLAPPPPGSEPAEERPTAAIPNLRDMVPPRRTDPSALPGAEDPFAPVQPPDLPPDLPPAPEQLVPMDDPMAPLRTEKLRP